MNAKKADKIATGILYAVSGVIVLILAALLIYILARGIPHISWEFLTQPSRAYQVGGGIGIQLFNSLYLLLITMIISIPISLGAGIYLSEYAKKNWLTDLIRTSIEILSSLPFRCCRAVRLLDFRCTNRIWLFNLIRCVSINIF